MRDNEIQSTVHFSVPTKIQFISTNGSEIGAVVADCVAPHYEGTNFYFGRVCVAVLSGNYLVIGLRKIARKRLMSGTPYRYDAEAIEKRHRFSPVSEEAPLLRNPEYSELVLV